MQVTINRLKAYRAREICEQYGVNNHDILHSSIFYQLYKELSKETLEKLCMSYTHPMDDGQARIFKVRFEGEGADDYGMTTFDGQCVYSYCL